ncbi:hypothetical protein B0H10DRAFT_1799484 [Mycena sp. CBHHK59/15]|nr:hypothetical protein B0H10DRAFT_1799484 [Mycena sp. CBHHK59/15]
MAAFKHTSPASRSSDSLLPKVREIELPTKPSWLEFLRSEVDPENATGPLAVYCFMTGFIDAISFTAVFVWCGFQTGNFAQLALALARLVQNHDFVFHIADQQALTSLVAFNFGASIGRLGDRIGPHTRLWLVSGTLLQALFSLAAAFCIGWSGQDSIALVRGEPIWTNYLTSVGMALMAASLGLQGIIGKRLNTHFGTTVVLTAVWVELVSDPGLFKLRNRIASRDYKIVALIALFIGAILARLVMGTIGAAGALGFAAFIRYLVAIVWIYVPGKGDGYTRLQDHEPEQDTSDGRRHGLEALNYGTLSVVMA